MRNMMSSPSQLFLAPFRSQRFDLTRGRNARTRRVAARIVCDSVNAVDRYFNNSRTIFITLVILPGRTLTRLPRRMRVLFSLLLNTRGSK